MSYSKVEREIKHMYESYLKEVGERLEKIKEKCLGQLKNL